MIAWVVVLTGKIKSPRTLAAFAYAKYGILALLCIVLFLATSPGP
jgi:hypothetical protein